VVAAQAGHFHGRLGDKARSAQRIEQALRLRASSPFVNYYAALAAANAGERDEAAELVRSSIEAGYPEPLLRADPVLGRIIASSTGGAGSRTPKLVSN